MEGKIICYDNSMFVKLKWADSHKVFDNISDAYAYANEHHINIKDFELRDNALNR